MGVEEIKAASFSVISVPWQCSVYNSGGNFGLFAGQMAVDERKAGERRGGVTAPSPATNARSAGIFIGVKQGVVNEKIMAKGWRDSPYP